MFGFIRKRLSRTIMTVIAVSVALVMGTEIYLRVTRGTKDRIEMMTLFGRELAASTHAGIKHPMSVGDRDGIEKGLLDVREKTKGVEVFICDFNQEIIYSTHKDKIKTQVKDSIYNKSALQTLNEVLKSGIDPQKAFEEEVAGKRYLVTMHPILNQPDCFHCHGSSKKVLGSMIIRMSTDQIYTAIISARNRSVMITVIGIGVIIVLTYAMLAKLVSRPIESLSDKAKRFAEGDMTVSADVKTENEVGVLGNSFNYMVKGIKDQIEYANSIKDAICDPLFMVDRDMIVTYMNEACERLTGYTKAEVEGKMACTEIFKSDVCETNCPVRYCFDKGEPVEGIRVTMTDREGKRIPMMTSASPLRDARGELIGAVEICKDITDVVEWTHILEKRVEEKTEEIRKAHEQLIHSEKLASLGRMAAGVAHEINNPLTGIVTFGHLLLKRFPGGSEEREDVEVIIEQANRCANIIKGLLGFARATSAEKIPVGINGIVNSSLDMVRHKADFFDIKFVLNFDEALPPIKANAPQVQQVFLNMLINAADAMEGKGTLTISTRKVIENGKPFAEVEFTDTGHGIPEENISKLFEPFFTTKPVGKGVGLGLAVSHGIIQDHGGEILVKSKVGEGTSFFARLPFYEE